MHGQPHIRFISKVCFPLKDSDVSVGTVVAVVGPLGIGLPRAENTGTLSETECVSVCPCKGDRINLLWWDM